MSGRIVIPLHNSRGELVGYAGRSIDSSEPKYRLSDGFQKSIELFNLHRVKPVERSGEVFVVEGFFSAMKLHQAGFTNVVALMGCSISDMQIELLSRNFTHAVLLLDEDEAGLDGTITALLGLSHFMYVTTGCMPKDIDDLTDEEIRKSLSVDVVELKKQQAALIRVK
jgi:DNA primase